MTLLRYGNYALQAGDSDTKRRWGGRTYPSRTGNHVKSLQSDLGVLRVYFGALDGIYGPNTRRAVQMLQWNAKHVRFRIRGCAVVTDPVHFAMPASGKVNCETAVEIERWLCSGFCTTGDLVRIKAPSIRAVELGAGFRRLSHPQVTSDQLVVANAMVEDFRRISRKAHELCLKIVLNQTFRVDGAAVTGAVVPPARRSQHLIGHALDCNIVDGDNWNNSSTFAAGGETDGAKKFIKAMKDNGLRWGGDFGRPDTPHFDRRIAPGSNDYDFKHFFNQRVIAENSNMPLIEW